MIKPIELRGVLLTSHGNVKMPTSEAKKIAKKSIGKKICVPCSDGSLLEYEIVETYFDIREDGYWKIEFKARL